MKISFNSLLYAFSCALDYVEHDLLGIATHHSKRVAYMSVHLGESFGLGDDQKSDLAACALLHDNALNEYIQEEVGKGNDVLKSGNLGDFPRHCIIGEQNANSIPFFGRVDNVILYHHENADGSGPFGKRTGEIPLYASLIHLTDQLDTLFDLSDVSDEKYRRVGLFLKEKAGALYAPAHAEAFLDTFSRKKLNEMADPVLDYALNRNLPSYYTDYSPEQVASFASIFAKIIDYKSRFTKDHSVGVAEKAAVMADYFRFSPEEKAGFFLAAALHDIGKLAVDVKILEKPDRLSAEEYAAIQQHALYSYRLLRNVKGFSQITSWASLHHEKLDGTGYPFGLKAANLGFEERLMTCIDIYQALIEKRPYKASVGHGEAICILNNMAHAGLVDADIVDSLHDALKKDEEQPPETCIDPAELPVSCAFSLSRY